MDHALISVYPNHVLEILSGSKTVEIRNRPLSLSKGTNLWMYSTLPIGAIQAVAKVMETNFLSPTKAWELFEHSIGLTRSAYRAYVNGSPLVSVIRLGKVTRLHAPLSLALIRESAPDFQPPQFFSRLEKTNLVYRFLARYQPTMFR
jgi:predicted transcriptional regulator